MSDNSDNAGEMQPVDHLERAVQSLEEVLVSYEGEPITVRETSGDIVVAECYLLHEMILEIYRQLAAHHGSVDDYKNIAHTALELGDFFSTHDIAEPYYREARESLQHILKEEQDTEYLKILCRAELSLGEVLSVHFDNDISKEHLKKAYVIASSIKDSVSDPDDMHIVGKVLLFYAETSSYMQSSSGSESFDAQKTLRDARRLLTNAVEELRSSNVYYHAGLAAYHLANVVVDTEEKHGLVTEALDFLKKSYQLESDKDTQDVIDDISQEFKWLI